MAISYIGGRTQGFFGTTSNVTVSLTNLTGGIDTAPSAGDFVVVFFGTGSNVTTRNITIGASQGWTNLTKINADSTYDTNYVVAYKRMGSTPDTSVLVSNAGIAADSGGIVVHVFRGVDETTPLDVAAVPATGSSTSLANPAAITPVTSGAIIIASAATGHVNGTRTFSSPELFNFVTRGSNGTYDVTVGAGWIDWTSGAFDPAAFSWSGTDSTNNSWAAYTLALRPAPIPVNVTPNNLVTGSPVLGTPTLTVVPAIGITPNPLTTASPVIGSPTVAQVHSLTPAAIVTGAVVLGAAALSQGHVLAGQGIVTGAPEVGQAALSQVVVGAATCAITSATAASGRRIAQGSATAAAVFTTAANGARDLVGASSSEIALTVTANGERDLVASAVAAVSASVTASAERLLSASASALAVVTVTATREAVTILGQSSAAIALAVSARGRLIWEPEAPQGEAWVPVGNDGAGWAEQGGQSEIWTERDDQAEIYTLRGNSSPTWT